MNDLMNHRGEFARAIRNRKFDVSDAGILFPQQQVFVGGAFDVEHRRGGDVIGRDLSANLLPTEGLNHLLDVVLHGTAQVTTWYVALFEGNYTPVAGLTAATFTASATECTAYDESTRVAYDEGAASGGVIDNASSRATFTMNASKTVYGGALLSASAKSATSGVLLAAARFSSSRSVVDDDELAIKYTITATSS